MSVAGTIMDNLQTLAEGAISGLVAERVLGLTEDLTVDGFPHLYIHSAAQSNEILDQNQEARVHLVACTFVFKETDSATDVEEAALTALEAFQAALLGDPTLTAACDRAWVSSYQVGRHAKDRTLAIVSAIVSAQKVAGA